MKKQNKRLISFILSVLMLITLIPVNAIVALAAPEAISLGAYPSKVSVGQTSQITVTDTATGEAVDVGEFDFSTSNGAIAVVDENGVVTGVHSGTAVITATHKDDAAVTATLNINVTATSTYNLSIEAFNIGNDTDDVPGADKFGNEDSVEYDKGYIPENRWNDWTDTNAAFHVPYYATTTGDVSAMPSTMTTFNSVQYRGRTDVASWHLYMHRFTALANPAKSEDTYKYMNLNNTNPWRWLYQGYSGIDYNNNFFVRDTDVRVLSNAAVTNDSKPYYTLILNVPAAGNYKVDVSFLYNSEYNIQFYASPVVSIPNSVHKDICTKDNFIGSFDNKAALTGRLEKTFVADEAGDYYFVVMMGDGATGTPGASGTTYFSSISLTLEEWSEPSVIATSTVMTVGASDTLSVGNVSTFGNKNTLEDATFAVEGDALYLQDNGDGTAKITAVKKGEATVTATFGDNETRTLTFKVVEELNYVFSQNVFNYAQYDNFSGALGSSLSPAVPYNPNATKVIKFAQQGYIANTAPNGYKGENGVTRYVSGVGIMLYAYWGTLSDMVNPEYQNSELTAPWTWMTGAGFNSGNIIGSTSSYLYVGYTWIKHKAFSNGNEPYTTFKIEVPSDGTYHLTLDTAAKSTKNLHFYLVPAAEVTGTPDRSVLLNDEYEIGNIDNRAGEQVKTFTKYTKSADEGIKLTAGSYSLVVEIAKDGDDADAAEGYVYFGSAKLTPDVLSAATVSNNGTDLTLGQKAEISVSQTGTISGTTAITNAAYSSNNPLVARVTNKNGVATVVACGEGNATITVTYTDLFGIQRTEVINYTVSAPNTEKFVYNTTIEAFNIGNGNGDFGQDLEIPNDWTDETAGKFIPYEIGTSTEGTNGKVYYDTAHKSWGLFPMYSDSTRYGNIKEFVNSYDYQNLNNTAPWQWIAELSWTQFDYGIRSINTFIGKDYTEIKTQSHYPETDLSHPTYVTIKIKVPTSGEYNVTIDTGKNANLIEKFYIAPVSAIDNATSKAATFLSETYNLMTIDAGTTTTGTVTKTLEAGEYYVAIRLLAGNYASAAKTGYLKSITLDPVVAVADAETSEITAGASLGSDVKMHFNFTPVGYKIAGYNIYVDDNKIGYFDVETGVTTENVTISIAANQMSKDIVLEPVDGAGNPVGETKTTSFRKYLDAMISSGKYTGDNLALLKHTYNYCSYAEKNSGTDTEDWKIYEDTTAAAPGTFDSAANKILDGSTDGIAAKSATLLLKSKVVVRIYFEVSIGTMDDYTFTYKGNPLTPVESGNRCYVDIEGINPQNYADEMMVTVTNAQGGTLTVSYNPMAYIQRTYHSTDNEALKNLLQAMNGFYTAAAALFN